VVVSQGSSSVRGTWVPLASAQAAVMGHPHHQSLDMFLSDTLFELFPTPLQDFHRSNAQGRSMSQFGPDFKSTMQSLLPTESATTPEHWDEAGSAHDWVPESPMLLPHPTFSSALDALRGELEEPAPETPLSPTEQEMFQALCFMPEWEKESASTQPIDIDVSKPKCFENEEHPARRRSRRVANLEAVATRTRTRSQKRGTRNSLS